MTKTYCGHGEYCGDCQLREDCGGCAETGGSPFGKECLLAACCKSKGLGSCGDCASGCELKAKLIEEINALGIKDMPIATELFPLKGSFVNLSYAFPSGDKARLFDDDKLYLGAQLPKAEGRCFGIAADEKYIAVCEYGEGGADAELVMYKRR